MELLFTCWERKHETKRKEIELETILEQHWSKRERKKR
jgi:hypothetical protein